MSEQQNFEVLIASDVDYEAPIAEVYINGKICALVTFSETGEGFDIIIRDKYITEEAGVGRFRYDVFCKAIEAAKNKLENRDQFVVNKLFGIE